MAAWCVVVLAPGYLLVGRHIRNPGAPAGERFLLKFIVSIGCGLLAVPIPSLALSAFGPWWRPWFYLPLIVLASWALGTRCWWRSLAAAPVLPTTPDEDVSRKVSGWPLIAVGAACLAMLLLVLAAHAETLVPRGDGANHAYMARRIVEAGSVLNRDVFAEPYGRPDVPYFMGWHAAAAQIAQLGNLPAYVTAWLLPLQLLCLLPAALYLVWRTIPLSPAVCCLAAWLLLVNDRTPTGVLGWGGLGYLVGCFLVPVLVLSIRAVALRGDWRGGLMLGGAVVAMIQIHAAELVAVLLLSVAGLWRQGLVRRSGIVPALGVAAVGAGLTLLYCGLGYGRTHQPEIADPLRQLGRMFDMLLRAGGYWEPLRIVFLAGFIVGFRNPGTRRFTGMALGVSLLFLCLASFRDPVSQMLSRPLYQEPSRVLAVLAFFAPPLMAQAFAAGVGLVRRRWPGRVVVALAAAVLAGLLVPGIKRTAELTRVAVPNPSFRRPEAELARRIADALPAEAFIANLTRDGSQWAWHLSERPFLQPCTWPLRVESEGDRWHSVLGFTAASWPVGTRALRSRGVTHLYVSETTDRQFFRGFAEPFTQEHFDQDPRFTLELRGEQTSIYRIDWDRDQGLPPLK